MAALIYDPLLRLYQTSAAASPATRFQYDGLDMAGEYDASGVLQKRYVFAGGGDDPIVEYTRGTGGTYTRAWLLPDERGSIVSRSDDTAASTGINSYDEYGVPASGNTGRFGYTGQAWLPELGLWYYKARMYAPALGRFLQTDPIGYGDGMNWYGYVGGDPVNLTDPSGQYDTGGGDVVVPAPYSCNDCGVPGIDMFHSNGLGSIPGLAITDQPPDIADIVVNGVRDRKPKPIYGSIEPLQLLLQFGQPRLDCHGKAYVLAGNPANVGKEGFAGVTVTNGSAAVVPQQFTGELTGGPLMRAIGASAYGTVTAADGRTQSFKGITQAIGFARLGSAADVQSMIMSRDPDALIVEIVGGKDFGKDAKIDINLPNFGEFCPAGTN